MKRYLDSKAKLIGSDYFYQFTPMVIILLTTSRQRHTPEYLEKTTNLPQVTDEICQCLWQVGGCLWVLRFPQLIKWPTRYNWNIVALSNITLTPKHHTKKVPEFYIWANRHIIWTKSKRRLGQQKVSVLVKTILDLSQNFINKCYTIFSRYHFDKFIILYIIIYNVSASA